MRPATMATKGALQHHQSDLCVNVWQVLALMGERAVCLPWRRPSPCTVDVTGDVEAPKVDAAEAAVVTGDGNVQNVDFKNLSAEEAFQVLGVSSQRHMWCSGLQLTSSCAAASSAPRCSAAIAHAERRVTFAI